MLGQIPEFNDGLEFLRKMWGNAATAGMPAGMMPGLQAMTPPMDLDDVDKRIRDLKAVESWLQLNANLLRTTIQGLEVQRATLVALKTFGDALSPEAMRSAMENVARAANTPSASRRPAPPPGPAPGAEGIDETDLADMADMEATPDQAAADEAAPDAGGATASGKAPPRSDDGPQAGALPPQANLWWDMVQRQFNQIASGAAAASLASLGNLGTFGTGAPPAAGGNGTQNAEPAGAADGRTAKARQTAAGATAKRAAGKTATPRAAGKASNGTMAAPGNEAPAPGARAGTTPNAGAARSRRPRSTPKP